MQSDENEETSDRPNERPKDQTISYNIEEQRSVCSLLFAFRMVATYSDSGPPDIPATVAI